ncbi:efflux RND transporter permease subunit [Salinivibrio sp. KP-1]|uniref:efflux RND transporter permease subunit n=1 Tax=Salinivibrio sp. KP-1 TaxID=1406902 RepID=UPI00061449E6|nr:efflux RND transporter permease subunit [Salinivibrio sp. KP-1]KKA45966.1 acriflavin resistance protein [Salinivibrio sp. KP-1]
MNNADTPTRGLIAYFAHNPVAANLIMVFVLIMGVASYFFIQRQMFPNIEINYIHITADYPGASPQEVEESILVKVEEAIKDVTGIESVVSTARRGFGQVEIEVDVGEDLNLVLDRVKQEVDALSNLPASMEPLNVAQVEFRQTVIQMAVVGNKPLTELKRAAQDIEDELLQLKDVTLVELSAPTYEIAIEVAPRILRKYNLTLNQVSDAIARYSANFSAGEVRTDSGMIAIRVENQRYRGDEFRQIPIKIGPNGSRLLLQDIATIKDGFTEGERYFKYSGQNAIFLSVNATASENMVTVADAVKDYIQDKNAALPAGLALKSVVDMTHYLNARLDMMLKNLLQGAVLVALLLTLFLRFKLALWVLIGLPVCFLGAVMLMPVIGVSINIVSLFAFIMVLGIVVDDAIVIGESVYTEVEHKGGGVNNVVAGAQRVATPATFGVLTTIAVFAPFIMSSGPERAFFFGIASIVILCLIFSLVESKLILPAHLAHTHFSTPKSNSFRSRFNRQFHRFVNGPYRRAVTFAVHWRWSAFALFVALLAISISLVVASHVRMVPTPKVPHDFPNIRLEMNNNASSEQTIAALKAIEGMVYRVDNATEAETGQAMVQDTLVFNEERTSGQLVIPLVDDTLRPFTTFELSRRWREAMPEIPGVKKLTIQDDVNGGEQGDEFGFLLFGPNIDTLNAAGRALMSRLNQQAGLFDVSSSIDSGSQEVLISLTPVAHDLGLDLTTIAQQVGGSFYGGEAQRLIRDGEEIKVMVRYPKLTREAFSSLRYAVITTPAGQQVMLGDVVKLEQQPGVSSLRREAGFRTVYVYGAIDEELVEPNEVVETIQQSVIPEVLADYPDVTSELSGSIEEQQAQQDEQKLFFVAGMIVVYALLAVPLKSYTQPLIIMSVIPFSLTGAIWGHYWFDIDLSMMSTFGLIAAAGVVVNDALVMTDYINRARHAGVAIKKAVIDAGCARFRAITLTSITTFAGVLPIMFETSLQARFVIPMAVALGFAVMFATLLTLFLVPCLYLMLQDIGQLLRRLTPGLSSSQSEPNAR